MKNQIKKRFDVLSPDGFTIDPQTNYNSKEEAINEFKTWLERYKGQGYYSSNKFGRIGLEKVANYCLIIQIPKKLDGYEKGHLHYAGVLFQIYQSMLNAIEINMD